MTHSPITNSKKRYLPYKGLTVRLANILLRLEIKSKEAAKEAIMDGTVRKTRGIGPLLYRELVTWSGLNLAQFPEPPLKNQYDKNYFIRRWKRIRAQM